MLQIEHAAHISPEAKLVKLADKISNLRDFLASPPVDWSAWCVPGAGAVFDGLYARRLDLDLDLDLG